MMENNFSIENAFSELEKILKSLEDETISLQESMDYYKKGVELLAQCDKALDKTEKEIIVLQGGDHA